MENHLNLSVSRPSTALRYPILSDFKATWVALPVARMSVRQLRNVYVRKKESKTPTMLSFRSKCLLKQGRKWRKNSNKAYLMGSCPQADWCLWMTLSDELWWNSRLSSKLMCRPPSSLPCKWIIPWSPKNKLTQSTEFWIPPLRCSFQRCLRCNPKILPSFIANWRFSSTQTRTIIRRQRMRSRLSKERTRLPEPRCALPKAPSEWNAGHPRATAVTSKCPNLMSLRGFRRTIIISEEWDLLSE